MLYGPWTRNWDFLGNPLRNFIRTQAQNLPEKMMVGFTPEIERIDTKNVGLGKVSPLKYGYLGHKVGPYQF